MSAVRAFTEHIYPVVVVLVCYFGPSFSRRFVLAGHTRVAHTRTDSLGKELRGGKNILSQALCLVHAAFGVGNAVMVRDGPINFQVHLSYIDGTNVGRFRVPTRPQFASIVVRTSNRSASCRKRCAHSKTLLRCSHQSGLLEMRGRQQRCWSLYALSYPAAAPCGTSVNTASHFFDPKKNSVCPRF